MNKYSRTPRRKPARSDVCQRYVCTSVETHCQFGRCCLTGKGVGFDPFLLSLEDSIRDKRPTNIEARAMYDEKETKKIVTHL